MFKVVFQHHGVINWKTKEVFPDIAPSLIDCLNQAIASSTNQIEEEGGIILKKEDEYKYIKIRNNHTGTKIAWGLYEVDRQEYGNNIIPLFNGSWRNYATFHTHPNGCRPYPSLIDLTRLFKGARTNFIYSSSYRQLCGYKVDRIEGEDKIYWNAFEILL